MGDVADPKQCSGMRIVGATEAETVIKKTTASPGEEKIRDDQCVGVSRQPPDRALPEAMLYTYEKW